jgi:hypothetical protein
MSKPQSGRPDTPRSFAYGWLLGLILGIGSDIALWSWMSSGSLVDGLARSTRHHYSEDLDLVDLLPRFWYGLAFAVAMTLVGAILVARRITSVGTPLLLFAGAGVLAIVGLYGPALVA